MKSTIFKLIFLFFFIGIAIHSVTSAAPPPPPGNHGESGNQCARGGAPISEGLFILLGLATAYGGRILYKSIKEHKNKEFIS